MHFYYRNSYAFIPLSMPRSRALKIIKALMEVTDESMADDAAKKEQMLKDLGHGGGG